MTVAYHLCFLMSSAPPFRHPYLLDNNANEIQYKASIYIGLERLIKEHIYQHVCITQRLLL